MKDRNIICEFYMYEGGCSKDREGTFKKYCQTCQMYKAKRGAAPARKNLKRQKLDDAKNKDFRNMMKDY